MALLCGSLCSWLPKIAAQHHHTEPVASEQVHTANFGLRLPRVCGPAPSLLLPDFSPPSQLLVCPVVLNSGPTVESPAGGLELYRCPGAGLRLRGPDGIGLGQAGRPGYWRECLKAAQDVVSSQIVNQGLCSPVSPPLS